MAAAAASKSPAGSSRRTFSGRGRPRTAGPREPNGRPQRLAKTESEAAVISIALAQPHRRGDQDQRRHWLIGRLVLDGKVKHDGIAPADLERAAQLYAQDYARLQRALASRRPLAVTGGAVLRAEDPEREAKEYEAAIEAWSKVNRALRDAGERVQKAVQTAVLDAAPDFDERILNPWITLSLPAGLAVLCQYYGLDKRA